MVVPDAELQTGDAVSGRMAHCSAENKTGCMKHACWKTKKQGRYSISGKMNVNPGRNDPCPCGSGKKFKKCCAAKIEARTEPLPVVQNIPRKGAVPTPAEMNQLAALFNAGRYAELENRARLLVEQYPDSGFAWKALGTSLQMQGKDALPALQKATEFLPDDAEAHCNLGNALKDLGQLDDAVASYRRALEIKPDYAEAHSNLGNALQDLGQLDDAVASYRRALEIKPDFAEAHSNLGNALKDLGQLDDAVASYRRALEIKPDYAEAHSNLGNALQDLGQLDDAVASYRRALEIKPDYAEAHSNLGNALKDLGQLDEAVASYRRALEIKPDYAEAHNNLGNALKDSGNSTSGGELPPGAGDQTRLRRGAQQLGQCPARPRATRGRGGELPPGAGDQARLRRSVQQPAVSLRLPGTLDPLEYLARARGWERACLSAEDRQAARDRVFRRPPPAGRRLKVGYVSGDFRQHAVSYFMEQLFARHDRARIELFAYSNHGQRDAVTERLQALADHWVPSRHPGYRNPGAHRGGRYRRAR